MKTPFAFALLAVSSVAFASIGCAAPTESNDSDVDVTIAGGVGTNMTLIKYPDYAATHYAGDNSCVIYSGNMPVSWRYRFVLSNKGSLSGTIPMIKIVIGSDAANQSITKYLFNVPVAAGTSQVVTIEIPKMYPTSYVAEVNVDPANAITELTKSNNILVENVFFTHGLPGEGKCTD